MQRLALCFLACFLLASWGEAVALEGPEVSPPPGAESKGGGSTNNLGSSPSPHEALPGEATASPGALSIESPPTPSPTPHPTPTPPPPLVDQDTIPDRIIRVGTRISPPFVMRNEDGSFSGISIDLWNKVARELHLRYEMHVYDIAGLLDALEHDEIDVAVAALTVTAEREVRVDFCHPYYSTGLSIARKLSPKRSFWQLIEPFLNLQLYRAVAALLGVLLAVGIVVWFLERRRNEQFGGSAIQGIGAGLWWSAVTMTTVGYGDKAPLTTAGRFVALIWMFASIIMISSFTAAIATALTVGQLGNEVHGLDSLRKANTGTVVDSTSSAFLDRRYVPHRLFATPAAMVDALAAGRVEVVVYDRPILKYLIKERGNAALEVLPRVFERQDYAWVVPSGSALREPLNREILRYIRQDSWKDILFKYLGALDDGA